jgi:hypothetical protein
MSSWTADIEWHAGPSRRRRHVGRWAGALGPHTALTWDDEARTVTATVTVEAPSLEEALPTAVHLVEAVVGQQARVRRIAVTHAYPQVVAHDRLVGAGLASGPGDEPQKTVAQSSLMLTTVHP